MKSLIVTIIATLLVTSAAWACESGESRECGECRRVTVVNQSETVINQKPKVHQVQSGVGLTPIWWESKSKTVSVSTPYTAIINKGERVEHTILGVVTVNVWSIVTGNK